MRVVEMMPLFVLLVCGRAGMLSILRAITPGSLTSNVKAEKTNGIGTRTVESSDKSGMATQGNSAKSRLQQRICKGIISKIRAKLRSVEMMLPGAGIMSRRNALDRAMLVFWGKSTASHPFWRREHEMNTNASLRRCRT